MKLFSRRKKKEKEKLLAKADVRKPSYYEELEECSKCETEGRDETNNADSKRVLVMPYQIAETSSTPIRDKDKSSDTVTTEKDTTSDVPITENVSFKVQKWDAKPFDKTAMMTVESIDRSKSTPIVIPDKSLISPSSGSSTGDDIFDDLESVLEMEDTEEDRFLAGFLGDGSTVVSKEKMNKRPISGHSSNLFDQLNLNTDLDENSAEGMLNTLTSPVSVEQLNKISRGILIVDPNKNGEVYHMDEDNKSLTDKDLIIIGHDEDQDDSTVMSTLTEVTYQKSKEERTKLIAQHLRNAAGSIPDNNPFSSFFGCAPFSSAGMHDVGDENEEFDEEKIKVAIEANEAHFSLSEDGRALFQSLVGGKVDYGSFEEKIIVCITRVYLALVGENDHGLRCTYNEEKLSHDLGVRLIEDIDGQAVVAKVLPESTADRSGVRIGDKLSVSTTIFLFH